jgi:hypothetical protein
MKGDQMEREKKLTDISLVAYLVSKGFKIKRIDRTRMNFKSIQSTFCFDADFVDGASDPLEEEILRYFNHEALIDPLKFSETLRNLRSYAKQG